MNVWCVCGQKRITDLMRAFDMCEGNKIFARAENMTVTLKPGVSDQQGVEDLRKLMEAAGYYVALIVANEIVWRNPEVKFVSDGERFFSLDDLMEQRNG